MPKIPQRVKVGIHAFICGIIQVSFQVMIAMNLVAMVTHYNQNGKRIECLNKNYGKRYDWSPVVQGHIYGAFFWGSIPSLVMSGWFIQKFGARNLVTCSTFLAAILTGLTPFLCDISWLGVYVSRFLCGLFTGFMFPSFHDLIAKWIPPKEKGKFMSLFMSGNLGIYIVWSTLGSVIETFGWLWAWEIPSMFAIVWCLIFRFTIYNSPTTDPNITENEKLYIINNVEELGAKGKYKIPMKAILTNYPVWSLFLLSFGNLWGLFFLTTYSPQYLVEIIGEDISKAGRIMGFAFLWRFVMAFAFGVINDLLIKYNKCKRTSIRKFFCLFSHFLPGVAIFSVIFVGRNLCAVIILCMVSQGLNGAIVVTILMNIQELSPKYAGTISGLSGAFGSLAGIFSPAINGILISYSNTIGMWHISFILSGFMYTFCCIFFLIFGSSKVQLFNDAPVDHNNEV